MAWKKAKKIKPDWPKPCAVCGGMVLSEFYYNGSGQIAHAQCIETGKPLDTYQQPAAEGGQDQRGRRQPVPAPQPQQNIGAEINAVTLQDIAARLQEIADSMQEMLHALDAVQCSINALNDTAGFRNILLLTKLYKDVGKEEADRTIREIAAARSGRYDGY